MVHMDISDHRAELVHSPRDSPKPKYSPCLQPWGPGKLQICDPSFHGFTWNDLPASTALARRWKFPAIWKRQ
jgi:hypothetical protein